METAKSSPYYLKYLKYLKGPQVHAKLEERLLKKKKSNHLFLKVLA